MDFSLSEEQALFADMVAKILAREYAGITAADPARGEVEAVARRWLVMAEQGVLGLPFPEDCGGFAQGAVGSCIVLEACGKVRAVEPYLSSVAMAGSVLAAAGGKQAEKLISEIAAGTKRAAVALDEAGQRYDYDGMTTRATIAAGGGWTLNGAKRLVLDGATADTLIVFAQDSAQNENSIAAFIVDPKAKGVEKRAYGLLDGQRGADFVFSGVTLAAEDRLSGDGLLNVLIDTGNAAIAAECTGLVAGLIDITAEYVKLRKQFGKPLSTFQVLQHKLVDMRTEWELLKSAAGAAAMAIDSHLSVHERQRLVSAAKVQAVRAGKFVSQWAIQLHGAIGMTEECQVGWYARRLQMLSYLLGDQAHHLRRFAALAA